MGDRRDGAPGGAPPQALGQLSQWLARAVGTGGDLGAIEAAGHEIGREIAPERRDRTVADALQDALTALGFAPQRQSGEGADVRYVLGNCPYREAVAGTSPWSAHCTAA